MFIAPKAFQNSLALLGAQGERKVSLLKELRINLDRGRYKHLAPDGAKIIGRFRNHGNGWS
jgi:hypothetical protein